MATSIRRRVILSAAALAALAAWSGTAQAQLIASDSYYIGSDPTLGQYNVGDLKQIGTGSGAQAANLTNLGFVNGGYPGGTGTAQFQADTLTLNNSALNTDPASGKVKYNSALLDGNFRSVARNLQPVPASSTYWISHLINRGNIPQSGGTGYVLTGFGNAIIPDPGLAAGNLSGLWTGFAQDGVAGNFGNVVIRYRDTSGTPNNVDAVVIDGSVASTFGTTYSIVMKVDVNVGGGSTDAVSWWLNPVNFASESTLSSSAAASGTFNSFSIFDQNDFVRLNYASRNWNGNAFFDEARLSSTLAGLGGDSFAIGDFNLDGQINAADIDFYIGAIGQPATFNPDLDLNNSGTIEQADHSTHVTTLVQTTQGVGTFFGDSNLDGQVDVTDLGALATNWQSAGGWATGDFNGDGFVDVTDLGLLATNWQAGVGAPLSLSFDEAMLSFSNISIPEPASISLCALAGIGLLRRRRSR